MKGNFEFKECEPAEESKAGKPKDDNEDDFFDTIKTSTVMTKEEKQTHHKEMMQNRQANQQKDADTFGYQANTF